MFLVDLVCILKDTLLEATGAGKWGFTMLPLGKYIDIGSTVFKVIGVFQDDGGDNEERFIYIPYTTRQLLEKSNDKIQQLIVTFPKEMGHAGAVAFENSLKKYFKEKATCHYQKNMT